MEMLISKIAATLIMIACPIVALYIVAGVILGTAGMRDKLEDTKQYNSARKDAIAHGRSWGTTHDGQNGGSLTNQPDRVKTNEPAITHPA